MSHDCGNTYFNNCDITYVWNFSLRQGNERNIWSLSTWMAVAHASGVLRNGDIPSIMHVV